MSQPDQMPEADEQAVDWLLRHQLGLADTDRVAFAAWLSASPDNRAAWARAEAALAQVGAEDDPLLDAMRRDALSARPAAPFGGILPLLVAVAAAVVLAVAGVLAWRGILRPSPDARQIAVDAPPTHVAGQALRSVTLADGSQMVLDHDSAAAVRFTGARRDLRLLSGRALFDVRHDGRPFSVAAADVTVTATGTRFAVALGPVGVRTILQRGQVVVRRRGEARPIVLAPGEALNAAPGQPTSVARIDAVASLAWSTGLATETYVEFHDMPLAQAADQFNRHGPARLRVLGRAAGLKVNGRFRIDDPLGFVAAVTQALPVRQRRAADGTIELLAR